MSSFVVPCAYILHSYICSLHVVKITALCGASGFLTQGAQLRPHPEHRSGTDKTRPQNHPKHQHTLTQGAEASNLQQPSPSLSPCVPRYLLSDPCSLIPTDGSHREAAAPSHSHGTIPAPRSFLPIPRCARGAVPPSHSLGGIMGGSSDTHQLQGGCSAPPAVPGNAASTPKGLPLGALPFSSPVLNFKYISL